MEAIIYRSRTASQPCSLVEFLIGDGVNLGWLDQRVFAGSGGALSSASGSSAVACDRRDRQERGIAKWQAWEGDGQTSWNFPPSQLDVLECPAPELERMAL
jgi:hypothetical protein